jgi:ABC-type glycerol-3-phosphate transport system permease component
VGRGGEERRGARTHPCTLPPTPATVGGVGEERRTLPPTLMKTVTVLGLLAFVLLIVVPFWWIASMSFKTYEQIQFAVSIYVPRPFTWENYTGLWSDTRFPLWLQNSLVTAVVVTLITTVVASLSGYAVARLKFPGREAIASLILILYLVPPALLFIPLYRVLAELGTTNHLTSLFLSYPTFTVPFCTWLLIGFFKALPNELEEAAFVDGASRTTALTRVLLPLAAPGIVASAIFAFTLSWNEFLYALVFIQDETRITVPVGLNLLIYGDVFHWGQLMAASVITTVPVVALYMFIHRWMVEGLAAGSVKG